MAQDLGWQFRVALYVDSSVANAIASRLSLGKVRHLEVRYLWLQQVVADGRVTIKKVERSANPADLLTKILREFAICEQSRTPLERGCRYIGTLPGTRVARAPSGIR